MWLLPPPLPTFLDARCTLLLVSLPAAADTPSAAAFSRCATSCATERRRQEGSKTQRVTKQTCVSRFFPAALFRKILPKKIILDLEHFCAPRAKDLLDHVAAWHDF
jgi:hypothetical protein